MASLISTEEFGRLFETFVRSAFRLELLDSYTVPEEAMEYRRFLDGEATPSTTEDDWAQFIKKSAGQNRVIQRVHIVPAPLTPYLKYEIEWGYVYSSVAGEEIYLAERKDVDPNVLGLKDFWLFDRKVLVIMYYDDTGRFLHAEREDALEKIKDYADIADSLLAIASPLKVFLAKIRAS